MAGRQRPRGRKREALARLEVIADTFLSMNAPVQMAAPALLAQRHGFQEQLVARVRNNLLELDSQLAEQKRAAGWIWKQDGMRSSGFRLHGRMKILPWNYWRTAACIFTPAISTNFPAMGIWWSA